MKVPLGLAPLYNTPINATHQSLSTPLSPFFFQTPNLYASYASFPNPTLPPMQQSLAFQQPQQQHPYRACTLTSRLPLASPSTPSPPLNPQQTGTSEMKTGVGFLVWLSPQGGLLNFVTGEDEQSQEANLVSFEIKNFGDQAVADLTSVLRVGFLLKFQAYLPNAISTEGGKRYTANFVAPASNEDLKNASTCSSYFNTGLRRLVNYMDAASSTNGAANNSSNPLRRSNDPYDVEQEMKSVRFVLDVFRQSASTNCALHTLHCIVSNCGDEQLYNYIGTSSLKRRQFIERRGHLFSIAPDETICLTPGALYVAATTLVREMLKRGGAMLLQELFDLYLTWPDLPLESREIVGESKHHFLRFLDAHPWIFAVFPSHVFVAVRRRLPDFDYPSFLVEAFGDQEGSPQWCATGSMAANESNKLPMMLPSPLPTPLSAMTPKYNALSTSFNVSSSPFSNSFNVESNQYLTKFPFNDNGVEDPSSLKYGNSLWNTFDETPPRQMHVDLVAQTTLSHAHPSLQMSSNCVSGSSAASNSSVGSSSLSLSSFGSDPLVPATPPCFNGISAHTTTNVFQSTSANLFDNFALSGRSDRKPTTLPNLDYNSSATSAYDCGPTTPGFWKSYEFGTEDLMKTMTQSFDQTRRPHSSPVYGDSVEHVPMKKAEIAAQTEEISTLCHVCGSTMKIVGAQEFKAESKKVLCDSECQTSAEDILLQGAGSLSTDEKENVDTVEEKNDFASITEEIERLAVDSSCESE